MAFSEYFHGDEKRKPMCPSKDCPKMAQLSNGGYSPRDLRHALLFRHPLEREGSMLKNMGKLNPIIFRKYDEVKVEKLWKPSKEMKERPPHILLEFVKEVIRNGFIDDLLCENFSEKLENRGN